MEQEIQKLQERLAKAKEVFREMTAKDKEKDARIAELEAQLAAAVTGAVANNNAAENEGTIAELKEGEQEDLESEQQILLHTEDIKVALNQSVQLLNNDHSGIVMSLKNAASGLQKIKTYDNDISEKLHKDPVPAAGSHDAAGLSPRDGGGRRMEDQSVYGSCFQKICR